MKAAWRPLSFVVPSLACAACGFVEMHEAVLRPPAAPTTRVEIYVADQAPPRPFYEVALLEVFGHGTSADVEDMSRALETRARSLGCDGILRVHFDMGQTMGHGYGVCVRWAEASASTVQTAPNESRRRARKPRATRGRGGADWGFERERRRLMKRSRLALGLAAFAFALAPSARAADPDPDPEEADEQELQPIAPPPPDSAAPVSGMVSIPALAFIMGADDKGAAPNERPPHGVTVKAFQIDRTEVTVGAYRACVEKKRCAAPQRTSKKCTFELGDPELPITCVRWADAAAFCLAQEKRLPSEAEWEVAARGTTGNAFPNGSRTTCATAATLTRDYTYRSCTGERPAHVGTHPAGASPFGVLDLAGNVEEWVEDYYVEHFVQGARAVNAGASHVLRGGGWLSAPSFSRATSRNWGSVIEAGPNVGFRCAK